mgnify:CR=1 FL=1
MNAPVGVAARLLDAAYKRTFRTPDREYAPLFRQLEDSKYSNDTYTLKKRLLTFRTYQLERKIVVPKMVPDLFYYLVKSYEKKISGYAIIQISCVFAGYLIKQGKKF